MNIIATYDNILSSGAANWRGLGGTGTYLQTPREISF
jgi:hypothetical protein